MNSFDSTLENGRSTTKSPDEQCFSIDSSMATLHVPVLSKYDFGVFRSPGPGLGNLLFPIARALIGACTEGGNFMYPTMRQIKVGPYLRGERDKRTYGRVLRPRTRDDWSMWKRGKLAEAYQCLGMHSNRTLQIVEYSGLGRYFHDLVGHDELIQHWLRMNLISPDVPSQDVEIAVHVRHGDFMATSGAGHNVRIGADWYRNAIDFAKQIVGSKRPSLMIFTDGDRQCIAKDLDVGRDCFDDTKNALQAILAMSHAKVLVTSRSTFSMWAAYLGNNYAIWDREMHFKAYAQARSNYDIFI